MYNCCELAWAPTPHPSELVGMADREGFHFRKEIVFSNKGTTTANYGILRSCMS